MYVHINADVVEVKEGAGVAGGGEQPDVDARN